MVSKKTKLDAINESVASKKKTSSSSTKKKDISVHEKDILQPPKRRSASRASDEASGGSVVLPNPSAGKGKTPIASDISTLDTKGSRVRAKFKLEESLKVTRTT